MIFDEVRYLRRRKKISKKDKCRFLSQVPDVTLSMHIDTDPDAIAREYTDDDINELFEYWFPVYVGMAEKRGYLWK